MHGFETPLTRRQVLRSGGAAAVGLSALAASPASLARARRRTTPLPSARQVRADFKRMVDFGPRLTGTESHNRYIAWLEREFVKAGLELRPCDVYETERWHAQRFGLDVLEGSSPGRVKVAAYYPRSQETPAGGVTGPLVYGGVAPAPSGNGADLSSITAGLARYPNDLASWASGLAGTIAGGTQHSILLVDIPMPAPLTAGAFTPLVTFEYWPGHDQLDWQTSDYKRLWIEPGLGVPLAPFQGLGAAAVVFIVDASYKALKGGYLPFGHGFEPVPALYVDRDTGARLRKLAMSRPRARLTLTAKRRKVPTPSVTAVLPGKSRETIIFDTHTDGQGFADVGKTFKGLTDAQFADMTSRLWEIATADDGYTVRVRPEVVVEVAYNEIQKSPTYRSGLALRFARITKIRDDKGPTETTTLAELGALYERQFATKGRAV